MNTKLDIEEEKLSDKERIKFLEYENQKLKKEIDMLHQKQSVSIIEKKLILI
jgi:hypothetical protein